MASRHEYVLYACVHLQHDPSCRVFGIIDELKTEISQQIPSDAERLFTMVMLKKQQMDECINTVLPILCSGYVSWRRHSSLVLR